MPLSGHAWRRAAVIAAFSLVATADGAVAQPDEERLTVAVIVHRENPLSEVSRSQLERIFRLRRTRWPDGKRIYLIMLEEGSPEKALVLDKIYRMTRDQLKRFWLTKIYRGELTSFPKTLRSPDSMLRFVRQVPNAIGYVDARDVTKDVKVLRIEGLAPGAEGYPLQAGTGDE